MDSGVCLAAHAAHAAGQKLPGRAIAAAVLGVAIAGSAPAALAASALVPHAAFYGMKLLTVRPGSDVGGVSGDMAVEWDASCSGWTMNHRMILDVGYVDGNVARITLDATTWESRAGDQYTFSVTTLVNGRNAEKIEGHAVHRPGRSEAVFTAPRPQKFKLPDDVLFPSEHTKMLIAAAKRGRKIVPAHVFDGFSVDGALLVNAVIGKPVSKPERGTGTFPELAGHPAWHMQLAFFPEGTDEAEPQSEIGTTLYENGVARYLDMGFDDFRVRADLRKLDIRAAPSCAEGN